MRTLVAFISILSLIFQPITGIIKLPVFVSSDSKNVQDFQEDTEPVPLYSDIANSQKEEPTKKPVTLSLKANPQLIIPDTDISIEWTVNGWEEAKQNKNLTTIINFPKSIESTEKNPILKEDETGTQMELPALTADGKTGFAVDSSKSDDAFLIDVLLNAGDDILAYNSILLTKPSLEAVAGKDNHLVSQDGKVELDFPAKALSESLYLDVRDPSPSSIAGYSMSGRPVEVVSSRANQPKERGTI